MILISFIILSILSIILIILYNNKKKKLELTYKEEYLK
jgi:hypothetical protein